VTRIAAVLVASMLSACGGGGGADASAPPPRPVGQVAAQFTATSAHTGIAYAITVYTPAGHSATSAPKAAIYSLDHELQFGVVRDAAEANTLDAIIVSVSYFSPARRFLDFDLPGALAYYRFLTLELIPLVEAQYRIDPATRTLVGYSLSGLGAMITLLNEEPSSRYFTRFVMTDPSMQFHIPEMAQAEELLWARTHDLPVIAHHCATVDAFPYDTLGKRIEARGYARLTYRYRYYQLSHAGVLAPCVNDGLRLAFGRG
jgi:hypothetical protein